MSTRNNTSAPAVAPSGPTYFDQQRSALVNTIAINLEHVLQNMNKLNRSLEGVIAVGNEFGQVEGLWSQFENVMTQRAGEDGGAARAEVNTGIGGQREEEG